MKIALAIVLSVSVLKFPALSEEKVLVHLAMVLVVLILGPPKTFYIALNVVDENPP